jgi:hypothetical protein
MKVSYLISNQNTQIDHDFNLELEDIFYLLKELIKSSNSKNRLWVESSSCALDFSLDEEMNLWVEICSSSNSLWTVSEIDLTIGEEILKIAQAEKDFSEIMPTTNINWDAYTPLEN